MCGRICILDEPFTRFISELLGIHFEPLRGDDIKPSQQLRTISSQGTETAEWGIKPAWAKRLLINAQAETVATKKTFSAAFVNSRCLIPCSGWYEWREEATAGGKPHKQKYLFRPQHSSQPLLMAGILFHQDGSTEQAGTRLVTLTTAPTVFSGEYHPRMPLLIEPEHARDWLEAPAESLEAQKLSPSQEQLPLVATVC